MNLSELYKTAELQNEILESSLFRCKKSKIFGIKDILELYVVT